MVSVAIRLRQQHQAPHYMITLQVEIKVVKLMHRVSKSHQYEMIEKKRQTNIVKLRTNFEKRDENTSERHNRETSPRKMCNENVLVVGQK